jgi:cobaltochelatase CobN
MQDQSVDFVGRVFCFGLDGECRAWASAFADAGVELVSVSMQQLTNAEEMAAVRLRITELLEARDCRPIVLFRHMSMDIAVEQFFRDLPSQAMLVPIGSEAVLIGNSNADPLKIEGLNRYLHYSGVENTANAGLYVLKHLVGVADIDEIAPAIETPFDGLFNFINDDIFYSLESALGQAEYYNRYECFSHHVGILVHRHNWLRKEMATVMALVEALEAKGVGVIPVFSNANSDCLSFREIVEVYFSLEGELQIDALINMQMFAVRAEAGLSVAEQSVLEFERMAIPVISPIQSTYLTTSAWREAATPLSLDVSNALIAPEMSGQIEPILIATRSDIDGSIEVQAERVEYLAKRVASLVGLKHKANADKRLGIMLHNSVCAGVEATIGKAYGLDTFTSLVAVLDRLREEGYSIDDYPASGAEMLDLFMQKKAFSDFRWTAVEDIVSAGGCLYQMPLEQYMGFFDELPEAQQLHMLDTWGVAPGEGMVIGDELVITGIEFGNVTVMIQPKRGCYGAKCTGEVCKILHDPTCPPPHQYLATYRYLERVLEIDALFDLGTDGSLEYLPGKSNGLSELCWPNTVLGSLQSVYAYHAGVTNEALITKRRMNAVIVDYLPPASGGVDDEARSLSRRIDDYFEALSLGSGQEEEAKRDILIKLEQMPAASRVFANAETFDQGVSEVAAAILNSNQALNISSPHVFGRVPDEDAIEGYLREVCYGDGVDFDTDFDLQSLDAMSIRDGLMQAGNEMDMMIRGLSAGYIAAGESGMPDENGRNILPTGRNMFGMNTDKVPTPTAWQRGLVLAEQLIECYMTDEGRLPERIAMNMISLDVTRSGGEQLSQFLYLLGVKPVWDKLERVAGLEIIELTELGRPRIDATVRISGVLRDTWPVVVEIMDKAVLMVASLDESDEENFIVKHLREFRAEAGDVLDDDRRGAIRIFGDPPGTYGAGIDLALLASAWKDESDLARYFINASAYAYGGNLNGRKSVREFIDNAKNVDLTTDTTSSRRMNALSCYFGTQVQGGYRLITKFLAGKDIRQYQSVSERGHAITTESLDANLRRNAENTLLNEFWKESMMSEGYDGASGIMNMIQNLFSAQIVTDSFEDSFLDQVAEAYVNDEFMRDWLTENNPYAIEEIARRMLELYTREKWNPDEDVLERLKENYLIIEGDMEGRTESAGEIQAGNIEILSDSDIESWQKHLAEVDAAISD